MTPMYDTSVWDQCISPDVATVVYDTVGITTVYGLVGPPVGPPVGGPLRARAGRDPS